MIFNNESEALTDALKHLYEQANKDVQHIVIRRDEAQLILRATKQYMDFIATVVDDDVRS